MAYNPLNPNGQASMAGSQPVVIASNQSPVSVLATITGNPSISGTVNIGAMPGSIVAFQSSSANFLARIQGISADGAAPSQPVTAGGVGGDGLSHSLKTDNTGVLVVTGSVQATLTPAANQSVSGTVGASVFGTVTIGDGVDIVDIAAFPNADGAALGNQIKVASFPLVYNGSNWDRQRGNSSIGALVNTGAGSVLTMVQSSVAVAIISGSIAATFTPPANQSVSGTVGASIIGLTPVSISNFPTSQNVSGSVVAFQGTNPFIITGSVQGSFSPAANQSVSGTVGASIVGLTPVSVSNFPTNQNVSGSVVAILSSTNASVISIIPSSVATVIIGGSIAASFTPPANQSVSGVVTVGSILSIPGVVSTANSTTATLTSGSTFTGTSEDVKDFAGIVISVFADQASATDGLSVQQSSNGTNWDIVDTYTIPASTGKTFSFQPAARFLRVVYTNGGTNQGAFRLQTVYHITATKPSSQRSQDAYTNETDLEQVWGFNSYWNGATWDRIRGTTTAGLLVNPGSSSVLSLQTGTAITSIVGSYSEDAGHTSGDTGIFTMGVRNEQMSSITSADLDYSPHAVGPVGETLVANAPITKWVNAATSIFTGGSVAAIAAQGSSIFTYVTSYQVVNDSANYARLTFFGGTSSVIGYGVAPASSGSNVLLPNAMKTNANAAFSASISGVASVYLSLQGFTAKT